MWSPPPYGRNHFDGWCFRQRSYPKVVQGCPIHQTYQANPTQIVLQNTLIDGGAPPSEASYRSLEHVKSKKHWLQNICWHTIPTSRNKQCNKSPCPLAATKLHEKHNGKEQHNEHVTVVALPLRLRHPWISTDNPWISMDYAWMDYPWISMDYPWIIHGFPFVM